jgi:hypothetical protein
MNTKLLICGVSVVSFALGGVASYFALRNQLEAKYIALADAEVDQVREHYDRMLRKQSKVESFVKPTIVARPVDVEPETIAEYEEMVNEYSVEPNGKPVVDGAAEDDAVLASIDVEDFETMVSKRSSDEPYLITAVEFHKNDRGYEKIDFTYFEKDDVLDDGTSVPIKDVDGIVGVKHLSMFGHYSDNKDTVYVRNEELETDFCIGRVPGSYAEIVHGYFQHDDRSRVLKFRDYD